MEIDDELATYLQPGPYSIVIASSSPQRFPEAVRAWGPRVRDDGRTIDLLVGRRPSEVLRSNLALNGSMAVAIANITTYQALQMKGSYVEADEAGREDLARLRAHGEAFVRGLQLMGITEEAARGILVTDVVRLSFVPETLFDQTPGPEAGTQR